MAGESVSSGRMPIFSQLWAKMVMLSLPRKDPFSTPQDSHTTRTRIRVVLGNRNIGKVGRYRRGSTLNPTARTYDSVAEGVHEVAGNLLLSQRRQPGGQLTREILHLRGTTQPHVIFLLEEADAFFGQGALPSLRRLQEASRRGGRSGDIGKGGLFCHGIE